MPSPSVKRVATLAGLRENRVQEWVDAGLFERVPPRTEDWVARCHVLAELERANVPMSVLKSAQEADILERAYVLEFLQQRRRGEYTRRDVTGRTGIKDDLFGRICDALGLDDTTLFTDDEIAFFEALGRVLREGVPEPMVLETCELWGTQMRYIAAAEVLSYDTNLARRIMSSAPTPLEGAARIAPLTRSLLRAVDLLPLPLHHRHLLQALNLRSSATSFQEEDELAPGEIDVAIAFVDLSGFTAMTQEEGDMQALIYSRRLEMLARRMARQGGPRIIKRLGDGLMLASSTVLGMLPGLLSLVEATRERPDMPAARAAVTWGRARTQAGDYFGHTVNLAARIIEQAKPSEVLVTDAAVDEAEFEAEGGPFTFTFSEPRELTLRSIREPVRVWRVEAAD